MSMTHDEMIAVIAAHRDGKTVQWQRHGCVDWIDRGGQENHPLFNFYSVDYRIKPEPPKPREWWIRKSCLTGEWLVNDRAMSNGCGKCQNVHVREVLPEEEGKA